MNKSLNKKSPEELQEYLRFKRRGSIVPAKKGNKAYRRKPKHKNLDYSSS